MYQTCIQCTAALGGNSLLEFLPVGRRIAFDSATGRLWVVCSSCAKWNLVPFAQRLETIESCERLFRATPTRYATEHIGLARHPAGVDLIRVGPAVGEEFASWRFGETFRKRRKRTLLVSSLVSAGFVVAWASGDVGRLVSASSVWSGILPLAGVATGGWMGTTVGGLVAERRRLRLKARHPQTGRKVRFEQEGLKGALFRFDGDRPILEIGMGSRSAPEATAHFTGDEAEAMALRVLGRLNAAHGTDEELRDALVGAAALARAGEGASLTDIAVRQGAHAKTWSLAAHTPAQSLALEMYANEESERRVLAGELAFLERQWREADLLAKIADDLVLPDPGGAV